MVFNVLFNVYFNVLFDDLFNVLFIMHNIMFVDLENSIVFKLKKIDNNFKNQMFYYSDKQNEAEDILKTIQFAIELYNKTFKDYLLV